MNLLVKNITLVILICFYSTFLKAQHKNDTITDWDRTFMPAIQMGYIEHATDQLSGGLLTQTSIEYRHKSNFVLRLNYDHLSSKMKLEYPVDPDLSFTGKVSFSDLIGGVGYRDRDGKHNFTAYVEGGIRNYGYPVLTIDSIQANLNYDSRNIGIIRYTLGYEFALAPKLFLTLEALISHTLESKDFWIDNRWSYGFTLGISAPLF